MTRRLATLTCLVLLTLTAVAQDDPGEGAPEHTTVVPMGPERPETFYDALLLVRDDLLDAWATRDRSLVLRTGISILSGKAVARKLYDNAGYLRWNVSMALLMLLGQATLLGFASYRVRLMAVVFPRRPLGPMILGVAASLLIVPFTVALVISGVGIPFAILLWGMLFLAAALGKMGVFVSIGWAITRRREARSVLPFFPVYIVYALLVMFDPFALGTAAFLT
ncbi:hypothetical protein HN937_19590, partial [Candidatus Poribacteria bacterium]|nr:hypothetical protein [Candidatus Poribacteria bacterium]